MSITNKYQIGDIVTLKSHPLFREHRGIIEFSNQVPPLMVVKEIFFEDEKKKKIFSEELGKDFQVSEIVKYTCTYFSANKSEFIDVFVYESFLNIYKELKYFRVVGKEEEKRIEIDNQLTSEVNSYQKIDKYIFGLVIQFKTKKLEQRKSYDGNSEKLANNSFQTPDFLLVGIKNENITDLFYGDGSAKRIVSNQLYKVLWYNPIHQKNSEQFLPKDFFVQNLPL